MPNTPPIIQLPALPNKEKKSLQSLLVAKLTYKTKTGKIFSISPRRKIIFFLMMMGYRFSAALQQTGMSAAAARKYGFKHFFSGEKLKALSLYYKLDTLRGLNLDYTLDRVTQVIEDEKVSNRDKINALKLLANLKGQLRTIFDVNINETMRVEILLGKPTVCPHCDKVIEGGKGAVIEDKPAQIRAGSVKSPIIEGEFTLDGGPADSGSSENSQEQKKEILI